MCLFKFEHVTKVSRKTKITDDVSFQLYAGEIVGLIGPNGAGKTTIMKIMTGLYNIDSGTLSLNSINPTQNFNQYISSIGAIIEDPLFYPNLTGYQCLNYYAKLRNVPTEIVRKTIELVGLNSSDNKKIKSFSLGMRQRLGIAQALLTQPQLLILDEPFNGLDPNGVKELRTLLMQMKEDNKTIFLSSHTLSELELICDRVIFIDQGKIVSIKDGTKDSVETYLVLDTNDNDAAMNLLNFSFEIEITNLKNNKLIIKKTPETDVTDILIQLKKGNLQVNSITEEKTSLADSFEEIYNESVIK
ncbi:ABC transporter ATP-binding protein [Enterococcus rotai]|uniref:ABC transporter ATP-binding protein n=1 Tax=Enterococcus rotai TaxID=118060 RepID=UPI0032B3BC7D